MKLAGLFRRKNVAKDNAQVVNPDDIPEPDDFNGYVRRGYAYHSKDEQEKAEADFKKALELKPDSIDATYTLGLVYKAQGRKEEAVEAFERAKQLIEAVKDGDTNRMEMLRRLATGHINELTKGDWDLEETVWRRKR
jgi:tetratricopeptide (TPR) repeat protein